MIPAMRAIPTSIRRAFLAATLACVGSWAPIPLTAQSEAPETPVLPVLLVPGWSDEAEDLDPLRKRFLAAGWSEAMVRAVDFQDPEGSNLEHAREVAAAAAEMLARTGRAELDVVAHSMGGLAVRQYLLEGGADQVRRVVFLATPHRGTFAAYLAWGEGSEEMEPGSAFLGELNRSQVVPEGVVTLTIRTPMDLRIIPNESATLPVPGIANLEVCCPSHEGLLDHDETFFRIRNFLRHRPGEGGTEESGSAGSPS